MLRDNFRVSSRSCPNSGRPAHLRAPEIQKAHGHYGKALPIRDRDRRLQGHFSPNRSELVFLQLASSAINILAPALSRSFWRHIGVRNVMLPSLTHHRSAHALAENVVSVFDYAGLGSTGARPVKICS